MERNNKNILTIVMIALTLIVAVVLIAVFASRGAASDQTGETTTTTSKPEEEGPKFTVPKDGDGNPLLKTFNDAKDYCKTEYKGELAESSSLDDWKDPESVKTFLKGAIDGVSGDHFRIGLYTFRDTVKTESDYQVVGKLSDFSSDHEVTLKGSSINIVVKPGYVLENLDLRTDAAFICQHD